MGGVAKTIKKVTKAPKKIFKVGKKLAKNKLVKDAVVFAGKGALSSATAGYSDQVLHNIEQTKEGFKEFSGKGNKAAEYIGSGKEAVSTVRPLMKGSKTKGSIARGGSKAGKVSAMPVNGSTVSGGGSAPSTQGFFGAWGGRGAESSGTGAAALSLPLIIGIGALIFFLMKRK